MLDVECEMNCYSRLPRLVLMIQLNIGLLLTFRERRSLVNT